MIYPYVCPKCRKEVERIKPMAAASRLEFCGCGAILERVYTPLGHTWGNGGWDWDNEGLGDELVLRHKGTLSH